MLVLPRSGSGPAPAFVGIAFCGNQAILTDPAIRRNEGWMYPGPGVVDNRATEASRGTQQATWNVEKAIDRGYAVATFYNGDIEPDVPGSQEGVRSRLLRPGRAETDPGDWGTIAAWSWGIQRVVDYLRTVKEVDRQRIAVVGHSRNGKAALLAGALDERIALVISHQSGCGGAAPSRGTVGESVRQINDRFPHWFCARFKEFNDHPDRLPFDQNSLVALCAPRPVLFSNAEQDTWANPAGQFEALRAADPVYRLVGVEGLRATSAPPPGTLIDSRLGFFLRPGSHSMTTEDWGAFLAFADRWLKGGTAAGR